MSANKHSRPSLYNNTNICRILQGCQHNRSLTHSQHTWLTGGLAPSSTIMSPIGSTGMSLGSPNCAELYVPPGSTVSTGAARRSLERMSLYVGEAQKFVFIINPIGGHGDCSVHFQFPTLGLMSVRLASLLCRPATSPRFPATMRHFYYYLEHSQVTDRTFPELREHVMHAACMQCLQFVEHIHLIKNEDAKIRLPK